MFGLRKINESWKWAVFGKHPVAGDFLKAGEVTPLLKSFSKWMEKGCSGHSCKMNQESYSWRFWAKGPNKELICGVLQSSKDKHGRCYPVLSVGAGKLPVLSRNWDLIPYACEASWEGLEVLLNNSFRSVKDLRRELKKTIVPDDNIQNLMAKRLIFKDVVIRESEKGFSSDFMNKMNNIETLSRLRSFSVLIDIGEKNTMLVSVSKLLLLLKSRSPVEPDVVFLGGSNNEKRLFCLKRPLEVDDFIRISSSVWIG